MPPEAEAIAEHVFTALADPPGRSWPRSRHRPGHRHRSGRSSTDHTPRDRHASDAPATVCVDNETGVLLKLAGSGGTTTDVLVATEFGRPSDSDFQPPSPTQSAESLTSS
jgi:hypothetical protein